MKQLSYDYKDEDIIDVEWEDVTPRQPSMIEIACQIAYYKYIGDILKKPATGRIINTMA